MNAAVKRARASDREGSDGSGGSSPKAGKAVTTQKTREAGMTRRKVEARFSCPIDGCGSTFTRSHNLSGHLRSHADERPFKCDVCGRGFARQHDCKRHARLHVPDQASSFECLGCNKKFARSDGLAQHRELLI
ncbi:hypothetical protein BDY24DRAFT_337265 [Mrakia frigida]|uniref:uncharacterized protein n=1 Tax=Mrakia frigida TaxID=29902 RepID=UPI003FCC2314